MDRLELVAPDGTVTALTDLADGVDVREAPQGRFAPPVEFASDPVIGNDGDRLRNVRGGVRDVVVPISVEAADEGQLRARMRTLVASVWPTRGDSLLRSVRPDQTSRQLRVRYAGGLDVVEDPAQAKVGLVLTGLVLRAFDPYWEDQDDTQIAFAAGEQPTFFPFPPLELSARATVGTTVVVNDGDVDAWPVWTVKGPGGPLTLQNVSTQETLELDVSLTSQDTLVVDTRPGRKTIRDQDGTSQYSARQTGSALWPLARGPNLLEIELQGSTSASSVKLSYRRRYLTP